jgi:ADP-ribose pyrophosphatase YjhB (NUDIX family)
MTGHAAFCARCGAAMTVRTIDHHARAVCDRCGHVAYRNPVPAAGVVLVESGLVLMVRRKFEPRAGLWTLPAGFVEYDEHVEACAIRETLEETGLRVELTRLFGAYMAMDDPRVQVVLLLYLARRIGGERRTVLRSKRTSRRWRMSGAPSRPAANPGFSRRTCHPGRSSTRSPSPW